MGGDTPGTPVATGFDAENFPVDAKGKRLLNSQPVPKDKQAKYLQDQNNKTKGPVTFDVSSGSEVFRTGPGSGADISDPNVDKMERFNLWETLKKRNQIPDESKVTTFARNMLSDLSCVENKTSGMLTVFNNGGTSPIFDITRGGVVGLRNNWDLSKADQLASTEHIDALLKGAAAAKMTSGAAGANVASPNDNSQAMMEKAAQLAGLKIANPKFLKYNADGSTDSTRLDTELDKIKPGLAAEMNTRAAALKLKYGTEEFRLATTIQPAGMIPTAKTATDITPANAKEQLSPKAGTSIVLLVYNPTDTESQRKIDELAAMAGDKVRVVKLDVNAAKNLGADNPFGASPNLKPGLVVLGPDGKQGDALENLPATTAELKSWIEDKVLKDKVFTAGPAATAPAKDVPVKDTPKTAVTVTAQGLMGMVKYSDSTPIVLAITDKSDDPGKNQLGEMNAIAAKAGDKARVVTIDINDLHKYIDSLPDKDPLKQKLKDEIENKTFGTPAVAVFENMEMKALQRGFQTSDQIQTLFNSSVGKDHAIADAPAKTAVTPAQDYDLE